MFSSRSITLTLLVVAPLLIYVGVGGYALWQTGLFVWIWWILPICWGLTWVVAMLWKRRDPVQVADQPHPLHWTARDEQAAAIIREFQERVGEHSPGELTDPHFYLGQAQQLSQRLARHYHPRSTDPVSSLTVPEVLAAIRLAVDDMERWMLESVPGSHMVTIRQWRWLGRAPTWLRHAQNAAWAAGVLVNPANLLKYFTSRLALDPVTRELQAEFLAAVYLRFVRQVGFYLIEMNSGRLRGGADKYRHVFGNRSDRRSADDGAGTGSAPALRPESLTVSVVGQVKAGKSSLINALIGERVAESDVLPATKTVSRHRFSFPDSDVKLTLLDTPGYADDGATKTQVAEVRQAVRGSDVVLLVLAAHSPARAADREVVDQLMTWYETKRELKPPPIVICLTHVDLLSPVLEWDPPYDWKSPATPKERSIHEAVEYVAQVFSDCCDEVVAVCTDVERQRASRVIEELLPALIGVVNEGQTAALLRAYHQELNRGRMNALLKQLKNSGKDLVKMWVEERFLPPQQRDTSSGVSAGT